MKNPTPAPIVVPATGAPTCRGVALCTVDLRDFERDSDSAVPGDHYDLVRLWAGRAAHNGHVLCLRPTVGRPACVGLTATMFADASLQAGFEARALVVDPYDAEGRDIRESLGNLHHACAWCGNGLPASSGRLCGRCSEGVSHREAHAVAVWEASEAV